MDAKVSLFIHECVVYPFVQFSTVKKEYFVQNSEHVEVIINFVQQIGMPSLSSR